MIVRHGLLALLLAALFLAAVAPTAEAQPWPTTQWRAVDSTGQALEQVDRAVHGRTFALMLEEASRWYASLGFRVPDQVVSGDGSYVTFLKDDPDDIGSVFNWYEMGSPRNRLFLTGNLAMTAPRTPLERLMWASPVHELFHGIQWSYPGYTSARPQSPRLPSCGTNSDAVAIGWFNEGAASVLQVRWIERERSVTYGHPFHGGTRAAWVRYFDQPLHLPSLPASLVSGPQRELEREAGRSWRCGYGTWYFWYAVGDLLATAPGQEAAYLRYILEEPNGWTGAAVGAVDAGLKTAAQAFGSPNRVDGGLFELYPTFIAEYADTLAFYGRPEPISLRGRSEVRFADGFIEPIATKAFQVTVNVDDTLPSDQPSRFRVTLDPQPNREQMHLIEGRTRYRAPVSATTPYQFEVPVRRDTTFLVRLANVDEDAAATRGTPYTLRFELGGFYGAPASGPTDIPEIDIPPGFNVLSGPPPLIGCQGGPEAGSAFDLITASEAVNDIQRIEEETVATLDDLVEVLEDGDFVVPGMSPAQRSALRQAIESGMLSEEQLAEMRAAIVEAREELAGTESEFAEVREAYAQDYEGRSRLIATLVGQAADKPCQLILVAALEGEEGGPQQLSVADDTDLPDDAPMAVGIESVGVLVGSLEEMREAGAPLFEPCMMTPEQQETARASSCPMVCSVGRLSLEQATQNRLKGTLEVDMIRESDQRSGPDDCPVVERYRLEAGFNVTSANTGEDAEMLRGLSDETLRLMGLTQEAIDLLRQSDGGGRAVR